MEPRRFDFSDGELTGWKAWEAGEANDVNTGRPGLLRTGASDIFAAAVVPVSGVGTDWQPLAVPADILHECNALTLTGHEDDLWISVVRKEDPPSGLVAPHDDGRSAEQNPS